MAAVTLDGAGVARSIRAEVAAKVGEFMARHGVAPRLAGVLVAANPGSQVYVRNKIAACAEAGIRSVEVRLESAASQDRVLRAVTELNADPDVDAILVQLPLPDGLDRIPVLLAVDPAKDVDGLHP